MNWAKLKLPAVTVAVLCLASYVVLFEVEASGGPDDQISSSAVWNPSPAELGQIQQNCATPGKLYGRCFIEAMAAVGAPADAVAFTQSYADQSSGSVALLKRFRPMDVVDLGYVSFPAGQGRDEGWVLLNGTPTIINVDSLERLPQAEMMKDSIFQALRRRHSQIALVSGDRGPDSMPVSEEMPEGQRFTIDYPLKDGCRDCALLAHATFSFNFDPTGQLTEVKFVKVTPAGQ
jgi:hypothetical protein